LEIGNRGEESRVGPILPPLPPPPTSRLAAAFACPGSTDSISNVTVTRGEFTATQGSVEDSRIAREMEEGEDKAEWTLTCVTLFSETYQQRTERLDSVRFKERKKSVPEIEKFVPELFSARVMVPGVGGMSIVSPPWKINKGSGALRALPRFVSLPRDFLVVGVQYYLSQSYFCEMEWNFWKRHHDPALRSFKIYCAVELGTFPNPRRLTTLKAGPQYTGNGNDNENENGNIIGAYNSRRQLSERWKERGRVGLNACGSLIRPTRHSHVSEKLPTCRRRKSDFSVFVVTTNMAIFTLGSKLTFLPQVSWRIIDPFQVTIHRNAKVLHSRAVWNSNSREDPNDLYNAAEAAQNICVVNGKNSIGESTARNGFVVVAHNTLYKDYCPSTEDDMRLKHSRIKLYKNLALPTLLYGSEIWVRKQRDISRLRSAEKKYLRRTAGYTLLDHKRNKDILQKLNMQPLEEKITEYRNRWLEHISRKEAGRTTQEMLKYHPQG
ncbi:hypothetical protein ANN_05733, partial [Periplaneta americana]